MKVENIKEINTTALAYMGDAVYELAVREEMMKQGYYNVNRLHHIATLYVRASAFEALTGYLYLTENQDRLSWLMERAIGIVKDEHINGRKETKEKAAGQK